MLPETLSELLSAMMIDALLNRLSARGNEGQWPRKAPLRCGKTQKGRPEAAKKIFVSGFG
jgi:hypothetical protein